jgi:hypothetical protein
MLHDDLCERLIYAHCLACKCASRAYKRDPLPDESSWTPIWAIQKTPGQEGG